MVIKNQYDDFLTNIKTFCFNQIAKILRKIPSIQLSRRALHGVYLKIPPIPQPCSARKEI